MSKKDLFKLLEPFSDTQEVYVSLHSRAYPAGSHVFIQGVRAVPPWYPRPGLPDLVGLIAHADNAIIVNERTGALLDPVTPDDPFVVALSRDDA